MGWVDLLALGPTFMRYSGGASVPDSNPATFMVDGAYYNLSISLFDLFGDSPDVVPSKMRMAGRVTASPGATGTAYFGNGYLTDNYIVYAPLDANGEAQFSSGELDVGEAPYKYGNLVVGMESISPSQEVTFEITQFDAYFDVDDDEEPAGECFWTDLVNATQECGNAPDPEPPESPHLTFVVQGFGTSLSIDRLPAGSVVHWGDGEVYVAPTLSGSISHNYFLEEGVTAQGHIEFPDDPVWDTYFNFVGTALAAIPSWGEKEIPARVAFIACPNLTEVPTEGPPPGATSMENMFGGAPNLTSDITGWDTSNITNMVETFAGNASFNQDISGWDTSSVTKMHRMFHYASSFNQPIGSWDVSNVTGMVQMFAEASSFNQDLSGWCVSKIASEPSNFRTGSPLSSENCPVWGTCP